MAVDLTQAFIDLTRSAPDGHWRAPGRVNLIGEHTDYNDGFVLPFAIPQAVDVVAGRRTGGRWRVRSLDLNETREAGPIGLVPGTRGWHSYVFGVVWALRQAGFDVGGADLVLTSDVPIGAGLSSSAAIECAVLAALADLYELPIPPLRRAQLAQVAENEYVKAPTGLMDQAASTLCAADHALFLDCRTKAARNVPLALEDAGMRLLVIDTRTRHSHVDGEYAARRKSCERACEILGVPALRDVTELPGALAQLPELEGRRVRHVVTENRRVWDMVAALKHNDFAAAGRLMTASHQSMRRDYEITTPLIDMAVDVALAHGALGARMTGGGFGGCVLVLARVAQTGDIADAVSSAFTAGGRSTPTSFVARPAAGAHRVN